MQIPHFINPFGKTKQTSFAFNLLTNFSAPGYGLESISFSKGIDTTLPRFAAFTNVSPFVEIYNIDIFTDIFTKIPITTVTANNQVGVKLHPTGKWFEKFSDTYGTPAWNRWQINVNNTLTALSLPSAPQLGGPQRGYEYSGDGNYFTAGGYNAAGTTHSRLFYSVNTTTGALTQVGGSRASMIGQVGVNNNGTRFIGGAAAPNSFLNVNRTGTTLTDGALDSWSFAPTSMRDPPKYMLDNGNYFLSNIGGSIAIPDRNKSIRVGKWNPTRNGYDEMPIDTIPHPYLDIENNYVTGMAISPDERFILASMQNASSPRRRILYKRTGLETWEYIDKNIINVPNNIAINTLKWSSDGNYIAAVGNLLGTGHITGMLKVNWDILNTI